MRGRLADSESLHLLPASKPVRGQDQSQATLLVSFERRPRLLEFRLDGSFIRSHPIRIALYELHLDTESGQTSHYRTLALLDNTQGWHVDNFEGLTQLGDQRFMMVSDNNENPFQRSLLHHFRLRESDSQPTKKKD